MCTIRIMSKYGIRDIIKEMRITAIIVEKPGSIMNKVLIKKIAAKNVICNLI